MEWHYCESPLGGTFLLRIPDANFTQRRWQLRLGRNWPRWVRDLSPHKRHIVSDLKIRKFWLKVRGQVSLFQNWRVFQPTKIWAPDLGQCDCRAQLLCLNATACTLVLTLPHSRAQLRRHLELLFTNSCSFHCQCAAKIVGNCFCRNQEEQRTFSGISL